MTALLSCAASIFSSAGSRKLIKSKMGVRAIAYL